MDGVPTATTLLAYPNVGNPRLNDIDGVLTTTTKFALPQY